MSVYLNNNYTNSAVQSTNTAGSINEESAVQGQNNVVSREFTASSQKTFIDLPDDIFLSSIFPFIKAAELGLIASTSTRIHALCISSLIRWINKGNPIHELNDDAVKLIPFFAKEKVSEQIKWLNLNKLMNYTILIQGCSNFEHLKVSGNLTVSDSQCILVKKRPLKTLQILSNIDEKETFSYLSRLLNANPGLTSLNLVSSCSFISNGFLELMPPLSQMRGLQELDLSDIKLDMEKVKWIATLLQANRQLRSIHLHSNLLNDAGLNHLICPLKTLQHLETLVLSTNKISIIGAAILADALANLPSFQSFDLGNNWMKVGEEDEFLRFANLLTGIQKLSVFSLNDCRIDLSKMETFASLLLELPNLTRLDLFSNQLSIAALTIFCKKLEQSRLKCLALSYKEVESQGLKILGSYLTNTPPCLTELKILAKSESGLAEDGATQLLISGLAKQTFLTTLEFNYIPYHYDFFTDTQINLISEALKKNHAKFLSKE